MPERNRSQTRAMARQRRQRASPALYELMRAVAGGRSADLPEDAEPMADDHEDMPASRLGPGRAISLPSGYILLAVAIVIVVLVSAYVVGYRRADETARKDFEDGLFASQPISDQGVRDPLMDDVAVPNAGVSPLGRPEESGLLLPPAPSGNTGPSVQPPVATGPGVSGEGPIQSDPRVAGKQYWILMETTLEGAVRLAEFGRQQGVATYVVRSHNAGSRRMVIVAPGFDRGTDQLARDLRDSIARLGDAWLESGGSTSFPDVYPRTYRP
ncbi:MAG: hypothetical protein ACYTF9_10065 [Planctomycetota bacterium]